ncbi:MAG: RNA polymerase factor sigma-54 [Enterococcus sp.]
MKFEQNFSQKQQQSQKLAMTQQLQQSIQLLQFTGEELLAFVENKALENPLIEVIEPERTVDYPTSSSNFSEDEGNYLNQIPDTELSLFEHLIHQIHLNYRDTYLRSLVLYLTEYIDVNGFLSESLEAAAEQTGASMVQMLDALVLLQRLEPAGVGARNLQECLMLQTERDDYAPALAYIILEEYFDALVSRKWLDIAQGLTIELTDVQEVFDYIQTLTAAPGLAYGSLNEAYIIPEVKVIEKNGELRVLSNKKNIPAIHFQQSYFTRMEHLAKDDKETKNYLKEKQQEFDWLQKSLLQRGDTILRVSEVIVHHQREFFLNTQHPLRPLTLKEVAKLIDVHESTVSRAVHGKYLETSFGVFELKQFFTNRINATKTEQTDNSEDISADGVKQRLQELVDSENKAKPLSDQKLVDLLKNEEIVLSRRTVAKYRDALGIPSSSKRKRYDK